MVQPGVFGEKAGEVVHHPDKGHVQGAVEDNFQEDDVLEQCIVQAQQWRVGAVLREVSERHTCAQLALGQEV